MRRKEDGQNPRVDGTKMNAICEHQILSFPH